MYRLAPLFLILLFAWPGPAQAAVPDSDGYHRAFNALDDGNPDVAERMARRGHDAILNKVLLAAAMAQPGNDIGFAAMDTFLKSNPGWPGQRGIVAIAEQKIPSNAGPRDVIEWFNAHPPIGLDAFNRFVDALVATGQAALARQWIRARWITGDFDKDDMRAYLARYSRALTKKDHWARLDRLLWNDDEKDARRMFPYVDDGMQAVAEARLAFADGSRRAGLYFSRVPSIWQDDPGLIFAHLRWLRKNDRNDEAIAILMNAPGPEVKADEWWYERATIARRMMKEHNYNLAYRLASEHGQTAGAPYVEAEFLAGWVALRFLHNPQLARLHFQNLYDKSSTPISRARGAYWLGRAYEAMNDRVDAEQAYETGAALNTTYYGQLATTRIYAKPMITARPEPPIPAAIRSRFYQDSLVRAVEHLHEIGQRDRARIFFRAALNSDNQRVDYVLLTELAYQIQRPDLAIEAAKIANQKNMLVAVGGFPLLGRHLPSPPEPAFTHALIRQESMFNPEATSPAGAHGLMQLMPKTAKAVAKNLRIRFRKSDLHDVDYNLRLGTAFFQHLLNGFDGSYVLALASYNAGPSRVREWMEDMGDPRDPRIDTIDWIEMIPAAETRNYVQRILESLQIYRARLNGGQAPLLIVKDLKR